MYWRILLETKDRLWLLMKRTKDWTKTTDSSVAPFRNFTFEGLKKYFFTSISRGFTTTANLAIIPLTICAVYARCCWAWGHGKSHLIFVTTSPHIPVQKKNSKDEVSGPHINAEPLNPPTQGLILGSLDLRLWMGYHASSLTTTSQMKEGSSLTMNRVSRSNRGGVIIWPTFMFSSNIVLLESCIEILKMGITYVSEGYALTWMIWCRMVDIGPPALASQSVSRLEQGCSELLGSWMERKRAYIFWNFICLDWES